MGFWQTGYMEFHEEVGLGAYEYDPPPLVYTCLACEEIFPNVAALQQHRFECHPLYPPTLMLRNMECRTRPIVITSKLEPTDVHIERCDQATLNGQIVPMKALEQALAAQSSGICHVVLHNGDVNLKFTVEFQIASEDDLWGVEDEFKRIAAKKRLDMRTVEDFIEATREYATVSRYSDGICMYLYGVLAKERTIDCPLPYEEYEARFGRSVEELSSYDRPLARAIASVIEFHHNHFREAVQNGRNSRIAMAARKYLRWLDGDGGEVSTGSELRPSSTTLEQWVTDRETEEIVRWTVRPVQSLAPQATDLEAFLRRDVADFDRVKVRILLSELYSAVGETARAVNHAKNLENWPGFEDWANRKIRAHSEKPE